MSQAAGGWSLRRATMCKAETHDAKYCLGFPQLPIAPYERVGRAVVLEVRIARAGQLGDDSIGQHFAKLDAPLVERVDLPDHALGEDAVLVERDQLAERLRSQPFGQEGVGGPVAL